MNKSTQSTRASFLAEYTFVQAIFDIIVFIMYRYIEKNKLYVQFRKDVEMWRQIDLDASVKERYGKRITQQVLDVLYEMDGKYDDRTQLFNILDDDENNAISLVTYEDAGNVSARIQRFKITMILRQLEGIDVAMRTDTEGWQQHNGNILDYLRYYQRLPQEEIRKKATEILDRIITSVLGHIDGKYHISTTPNMITLCEKDCLLTIPYSDIMDGKAENVTTQLFWCLMHEEIHGMINCLRFSPNQFSLEDVEYRKVTCFAHDSTGRVPEEVATMAMALLHGIRAFSATTASYSIQDKRRHSAKV